MACPKQIAVMVESQTTNASHSRNEDSLCSIRGDFSDRSRFKNLWTSTAGVQIAGPVKRQPTRNRNRDECADSPSGTDCVDRLRKTVGHEEIALAIKGDAKILMATAIPL